MKGFGARGGAGGTGGSGTSEGPEFKRKVLVVKRALGYETMTARGGHCAVQGFWCHGKRSMEIWVLLKVLLLWKILVLWKWQRLRRYCCYRKSWC